MTTYTSPQNGTSLDTYIKSGEPTVNYSGADRFYIGEDNTAENTRFRSLLQPPGLVNGDIPSAAIVSSAKLFVKILNDVSSNARTLSVYRSKRDVNISQCTWNIWKTGSSWATAGGFGAADCEQTAIGSISLTSSDSGWKEISLDASAIQEIINGTWTTPTFLLRVNTEVDDLYGYYSSNNASTTSRWYIVVEYLLGGQVISSTIY